MVLNCIIDGNYILSRLVFTLHKNNLLYGALMPSLEKTIVNYRKLYPFTNVYLVSDSKEKSWRKDLSSIYKSTRKKDSDIDWSFVYDTYDSFKKNYKGFKLLEYPRIEGDDWISFLIHKTNEKNQSNFIISNDYDIKQLIKFSLDGKWINFMSNEMYNQEKAFFPKNYKIFLNKINKIEEDIFNLNDGSEFINLINKFTTKYDIIEIDNMKSLIVKIISGDISDNILSIYQTTNKSGKVRGIGAKGAETIYDEYITEFGEPYLQDPDLFENIADLVCDKKKISKSNTPTIKSKIEQNMKLIDLRLSNLPTEILENMQTVYSK